MPWSYANIDWNGTGAMVQAVGSVGAILVAVWVDQGAARRAARARADAVFEAKVSSIEAIELSEAAIRNIVLEMSALAANEQMALEPLDSSLREIQACHDVLTHLLSVPSIEDGRLIVDIANARQIVDGALTEMRRHSPVRGLTIWLFCVPLRMHADELQAMSAKWRAGLGRRRAPAESGVLAMVEDARERSERG